MSIRKTDKIFIAGHRGMVGSAVVKQLKKRGFSNMITAGRDQLDLLQQDNVYSFLSENRPDAVVVAAAKVGGILANDSYPYPFLQENLVIQNNIIHGSHLAGVDKLVFLGSSCIYPKFAEQPIREDSLLTGSLEATNQWYAIAKIAGVKMCEALRKQYDRKYVSLMPTNLYGPNDNFDLHSSHVVPAMIRKFYEAARDGHKRVDLWGTGTPKREFLHVDDAASAVVFALENQLDEHLYNVGTGEDLPITDLAKLIQATTGHQGEILWDTTKPDGTPRKLMNVDKLKASGWQYTIPLKQGIEETYKWFVENESSVRKIEF